MIDFAKIKKFVTERGDTLIVAENGEPEIVVMSFREYAKIAMPGSVNATDAGSRVGRPYETTRGDGWEGEVPETEFITGQESEAAQVSRGARRRITAEGGALRGEHIRLEDLPL